MYLTPKMYLKHTYKFGLVIFAFSFKAEWNSIYSLSYIWMIPVKLIRKLQRRENFLRLQLESPSPYYPRIYSQHFLPLCLLTVTPRISLGQDLLAQPNVQALA